MGKILFAEDDGVYMLKFVGEVRLTLGPTISTFLDDLKDAQDFKSVVIDLTETETIDSTALGLIAKTAICSREQFETATSIISSNEDITRLLRSMAMEQVCAITRIGPDAEPDMRELPQEITSEESMREQVLDAHRTLMGLTEENHDKFCDLVDALEQEKSGGRTKVA